MGLPIIDVRALVTGTGDRAAAAAAIGRACREHGFFYVVGHGVDPRAQDRLEQASRAFFAQPVEDKMAVRMALGGPAWRGYFPPGGELTSGRPDTKEGLYFGAELPADHPAVLAGTPLHGPNLFPQEPPGLRAAVLEHLDAMTALGHALMTGVALSLGLPETHFAERYTSDPLVLFRIFNYPAQAPGEPVGDRWGVGEHTDYGLLTILRQDDLGGLQVRTPAGWTDADPVPGSFVCNIGDMLDRLTGGVYRSTPHRVSARRDRDRLSWPFFFDPGFDADVTPVGRADLGERAGPVPDDRDTRWDAASVHDFRGTYGQYLLAKVGRVFPDLRGEVLDDPGRQP